MQNTNERRKIREAPYFAIEIPETKANKKREEYYNNMSFEELVTIIIKNVNENRFQTLIKTIKGYLIGINYSTEAWIACKVYYEKGGDLNYFISGQELQEIVV